MRLPVDYKKEVHKSVFNLSTVKRTTLLPGMIIPIYSRRCMAGDKFIIDINALLKSVPLSSPLYGTFKLQTTVFFDSDTNYYGYLDNNSKLSTTELLNRKAHRFDFGDVMESLPSGSLSDSICKRIIGGTWNNFRGSVLDYMGCPSGVFMSSGVTGSFSPTFDIGFVLTYLNIFRNYYANKQAQKFPVVVNSIFDESNSIKEYDLSILDDLFMDLRNSPDGIDFSYSQNQTTASFRWLATEYLPACARRVGGMLLTTYLPDLYRNLLFDDDKSNVSVSTTGNSFTIDTLRFRNKLQRLVDRFDISGGRFSDWLRTVWGVDTRKDLDIPEIIGASQSLIDPSQITSMAQTDGAELGKFGGNFDNFAKQRKHSFTASTPGRVMVCVTLVPMVDYSQGVEPELLEYNMADRYFPEFENLGYQKVPRVWYSPFGDVQITGEYRDGQFGTMTGEWELPEDIYVGKQVAWLPLMTDVNRCHGEFGNFGYYENWVLKRRYTRETLTKYLDNAELNYTFELNQYINPLDFQYPFAVRDVEEPNWFLQMALDIKAIRPKGKRFMPNLE